MVFHCVSCFSWGNKYFDTALKIKYYKGLAVFKKTCLKQVSCLGEVKKYVPKDE